jgi:hypothetical protein
MKYDPKHLDVEVEGIDFRDYPDFCDAFIASGTYKGRELTEDELEELSEDKDFLYEEIEKHLY